MAAASLVGLECQRSPALARIRQGDERQCADMLSTIPAGPRDPLPQMSESVLLTHLRTEAEGEEANLSVVTGTGEPGGALPGSGAGLLDVDQNSE